MSESIANRVSRIIAGSFNALVDAVEDAAPEAVMEQAVREIDSAIADVRNDLGAVEAQRHLTSKRLAEESKRLDELSDKAKLALEEGREDLASAAVERQIDIESQIPVLEERLANLAESKTKLEGYITALQAKKREMRAELDSFRQSQAALKSSTGVATAAGRQGKSIEQRSELASDTFDRIYQRQTGLKGTGSSSMQNASKLAELEELARQNRIKERLAQLKAK